VLSIIHIAEALSNHYLTATFLHLTKTYDVTPQLRDEMNLSEYLVADLPSLEHDRPNAIYLDEQSITKMYRATHRRVE
jgi:hypothetical protein